MERITLKLTKSESKLFDKSTENTPLGELLNMVVFKGDGVVKVLDVDKFREFLLENITDLVGDFSNDQNLKSIIMKLDNKVSSSRNELVRSISRKINASDRAEQQNVAYERKNKKNIVIGIIK